MDPRELLIGSFHAAVAAADPLKILPRHLPAPPRGRTLVIGAGKAGASMAQAVERFFKGNWNVFELASRALAGSEGGRSACPGTASRGAQ